MKQAIRLIGAALLLAVLGCGYHLQGRSDALPEEIRSLYIEMMENGTREPFLENAVTNAIVERFSRHQQLVLVEDRNRADAILGGRLVGYGRSAISYNPVDEIAEYRSEIALNAVLRRGDNGLPLWKGTVRWAEEYTTSRDKALQDARESAAIEQASQRLADELYSRIVDGF
ncbi:MAG: LPS assembly lipoprotein LptE [Syntrophotaleaceae bacterium]